MSRTSACMQSQTKPCQQKVDQSRPNRAPLLTAAAHLAIASPKEPKAPAAEVADPSRLGLALPWILVIVMTAAAAAFYALPEGAAGNLFDGPTLAIGQELRSGARMVPQPPMTQPLKESQNRRQTVLTPVWETRLREETYTIRKPVMETSYREEKYTVTEPVTTYTPQVIDQGRWVDQTVAAAGPEQTRLRWVKGGWTTNERGQTYWQLPGLRLAKEQGPATYTTMRVWQPNVVTTQIPQVSYKPTTKTRQVPVETVRYVDEQRVRKVPERYCRLVEKQVGDTTPVSDSQPREDLDAERDAKPEELEASPLRGNNDQPIRFTET